VREPVEASGTSGSCPEAGGRQWKSVEDKEGVGRGSGGSGEVQEVRRRSGRPWESAEEAGKAREVTVRYSHLASYWLPTTASLVPVLLLRWLIY